MGEEHHPLMGPGGGDELPLFGKPVRDVVRQVSGLPQLFDVPLRDGGDHPLASRSGHVWRRFRRRMWTCALELECARMDEQGGRRRGWKKVNPYPFLGADEIMHPHQPGKTLLSPSAVINGAFGLPTPVLMRIPE